jgi:phage tail sheath protein FI
MAERIVSPGVFTREKDLSFLPQGIGEIGAALIGQTVKGPAFVPTQVLSFQEFQQVFGGLTEDSFLPYTAQSYLEDAGVATIVRVLGASGYTLEDPLVLTLSSSQGEKVAAVLHPTTTITGESDIFDGSFVKDIGTSSTTTVSASSFSLIVSSSATGGSIETFSATSLNPTSTNYFADTFGFSPKGAKQAYTYLNFKTFQSASFATNELVLVQTASYTNIEYAQQYQEASTPFIVSQTVGGSTTNLFKVKTLSHGTSTNFEFKIGIQDIKAAGTVAGSEYGSFSLVVRRVDQDKIHNSPYIGVTDSDITPNIVETFTNLNLDPDSANYIARRIGDNFITVDDDGKLSQNGDYPNLSKNIRVEMETVVTNKGISPTLVPFGFAALANPLGSSFTLPEPTYVSEQKINGIYNSKKFFGLDFDFSTTDNLAFLTPTPTSAGSSMTTAFSLSNFNQEAGANFPTSTTAYSGSIDLTTNTALASKKFLVPFQGGFDGFKPNRVVLSGKDISDVNTQGFNCSTATSAGTIAYRKAINAVSNPDEFDINMLVIPGLIHRVHSSVTTFAKDMCEDRQDTFFVMDSATYNDNISTVTNTVQAFDSNYVATYYPWVKILDTDKNKEVWVTPSVVIPGVIAFNDSVAQPWFAPAGLNRGGLTNVTKAKTRLTRTERDDLYEGRVNPIASFPGQGVTVFGQKTLQAKPSALDRINVRRLLIAVKKFIASSSRFLVFEQNTSATRNRFLSIVNPFLEQVQQQQGLFAFRVVMDDSNNTPDVIDRNILIGEIFLQPTRTAEFIVLDFNVLPTGAAFPE